MRKYNNVIWSDVRGCDHWVDVGFDSFCVVCLALSCILNGFWYNFLHFSWCQWLNISFSSNKISFIKKKNGSVLHIAGWQLWFIVDLTDDETWPTENIKKKQETRFSLYTTSNKTFINIISDLWTVWRFSWLSRDERLAQSCTVTVLPHRGQDDIDNGLFPTTDRHLHGDAVSQREPSPNQCVVTSSEHTWGERVGEFSLCGQSGLSY